MSPEWPRPRGLLSDGPRGTRCPRLYLHFPTREVQRGAPPHGDFVGTQRIEATFRRRKLCRDLAYQSNLDATYPAQDLRPDHGAGPFCRGTGSYVETDSVVDSRGQGPRRPGQPLPASLAVSFMS